VTKQTKQDHNPTHSSISIHHSGGLNGPTFGLNFWPSTEWFTFFFQDARPTYQRMDGFSEEMDLGSDGWPFFADVDSLPGLGAASS
jgi:hypothetical protein